MTTSRSGPTAGWASPRSRDGSHDRSIPSRGGADLPYRQSLRRGRHGRTAARRSPDAGRGRGRQGACLPRVGSGRARRRRLRPRPDRPEPGSNRAAHLAHRRRLGLARLRHLLPAQLRLAARPRVRRPHPAAQLSAADGIPGDQAGGDDRGVRPYHRRRHPASGRPAASRPGGTLQCGRRLEPRRIPRARRLRGRCPGQPRSSRHAPRHGTRHGIGGQPTPEFRGRRYPNGWLAGNRRRGSPSRQRAGNRRRRKYARWHADARWHGRPRRPGDRRRSRGRRRAHRRWRPRHQWWPCARGQLGCPHRFRSRKWLPGRRCPRR